MDVVLLEGRGRLGGRADTRVVAGVPIDFGCSWIHEPVGNPMARFADLAGVGRTNADIELDLARFRFFDELTGELSPAEKADAFSHVVRFDEEADAINSELGPGASARDGVMRYLERAGLTGKRRRIAEYLLKFVLQSTDAHDWRGISLDYLANFEYIYTGIGQGEFPIGGYRRLVLAMAGAVEARLRRRVTRIEADRRGVAVTIADLQSGRRQRLRGSHVIVSVPLGVLKAGEVGFDPGLPRAKRAAIDRLGFGRFEKVALVFDEPFWEEGLSTHIFHAAASGDMSFPLFLDLQRIIGKPALVAFYNSTFAASIERSSEREITDHAVATLAKVLGRAIPSPAGSDITRWRRDRYSRGAYSTIAVGSTFDDLDRLAHPHHGRVLFAGEATSRARFGYADGAMSSGIREAKRLLRAPAVTLSAH